MAYAKKVYPRRRRSTRYRRRYRRRRYRRYNYRRRYRRTRRNRPEYKRKEFRITPTFSISTRELNDNRDMVMITPSTYDFWVIGCPNEEGAPPKCVEIRQGSGGDQRIGAKIRPVSLRISGTISIEAKNQADNETVLGLTSLNNVNSCMLRMIVLQVRNGDTEVNPLSRGFSPINPWIVTNVTIDNINYNVVDYNGQNQNHFNDPDWFNRMFAFNHQMTHISIGNADGGHIIDGYLAADRYKSGIYAKCPYRNGIGASVKILKDKLYYLNPTTAPSFAIRTKTKRPYRMVWKESTAGDNETTENCKNPIYVILIPIYPVGINIDKICMNLHFQLYYTDM